MVDLAQTTGYSRPITARANDPIVGYDELGREIRRTFNGVDYYATNIDTPPSGGAGGRGALTNLLDNIIGYDDGVETPGERLGAALNALGSDLLSDPVGMVQQAFTGAADNIAGLMAGSGTPMDALEAAGYAMGIGGLAAPTGAVGLLASESRAQRIARMLREGRGDEITDDMLAALDANDSMELTDLYASGATGQPMPMDFESRMARADQYFPDIAYHSTGNDFQEFIPSEFRGASFFGPTPRGASAGASASANEGVGSGSTITMPVRVDTSRVEGLGAYGRMDMNEFRDALQDRIYTEAEVDELMASDLAPRYGDWTYFFDDLTDYDALRRFRDENPDAPVPDGIIAFQPRQRLSYGPGLQSDISGRQFAHYSEGMSERPISEYTKSIGNTGFTMMDESGLALAMTDPSRIRSRFARFDPRLSHSANLLAANASPTLGLLTASAPSEQEQLDQLRAYLGLLAQ